MIRNYKPNSGFTLIEVAVVLVIVGFLLASVLMPLRSQQDSAKIAKAREDLKSIEEALYGFAIANGRLPCPAQPSQAIPGQEDPVGGSTAATNCSNNSIGFVPSATLGLRGEVNCDGLLMDPWGRPYFYSVTLDDHAARGIVGSPDFTTTGDMQAVTIAQLTLLEPFLSICTDSTCGTTVANNAVAVFFSMGKNFAATPDQNVNTRNGTRTSTCTPALPNYRLSNNNRYVSRSPVEIPGQEFDDIVFWISPNILYSRMLAAGQLP